ncbi:UDP-N-acetylmuramoyl-tripeptide--D-alanyl-D-alanine ligase [Desulfitispora alkaliphila]|uniref:UDP-N-acetylmuramoyl-tripeptide--D-alanyl-D- alanine ligase n=1 Tax=Desulfitispora alkaliphila TaxID=622674 RepID=UPI003D1E1B90
MKIKIKDVLEGVSGHLASDNEYFLEKYITGVSTDTRNLKPGELFIALKGDNFDGHDFVVSAMEKGANAAIVDESFNYSQLEIQNLIVVKDTLIALQNLAKYYKESINLKVIGITGSNGKTTTKDIIASVLSEEYNALKTEGNFNNEIGLPLTLFRLKEYHQVLVVEMGMRGIGQIEKLCTIAKPDIGVITNIGTTHIEILGSQEQIAAAKGELIASLPKGGLAVINGDTPYAQKISCNFQGKTLFFGKNGSCEVLLEDEVEVNDFSSKFTVTIGDHKLNFSIPLPGEHNVYNSMAAIGIALELGLSPEKIQEGLEKVKLSQMRLEVIKGLKESTVINDAYNANPDSMKASLRILKQHKGKRKIAVLGNMYELGEYTDSGHREVGNFTSKCQIDLLVTVGDMAKLIAEGAVDAGMQKEDIFALEDNEQAIAVLKKYLNLGDIVLVKGSRGMKMEKIVNEIKAL